MFFHMSSSVLNTLHHSGSCFSTGETTLTHPNPPETIVYIKINAGGCTFFGFGYVYSDRHHSLQSHAK